LAANPLASSSALNAVTGAAGALTKGLDDLKSGKLSLASLASAGLPAGASAQLNAAISSMSSGGAVQIKLPTIAINTNDRSELTSQVTSLLGDAKIPAPNFTGNPATTGESAAESDLQTFNKKRKDQQKRYNEQFEITKTAKLAWIEAAETLPTGDPSISELKKTYETAYLKTLSIIDELNTLT